MVGEVGEAKFSVESVGDVGRVRSLIADVSGLSLIVVALLS